MEKLQNQLMELAIRNTELTQRVLAVEAVISTPTPQKVVLPSVIATRLLKQPVAFDGDIRNGPSGQLCSELMPVQSACAWSS